MAEGYDALSEKEKEALRLMLRGHDAKSMARELSLSVHTINERLRVARRKLDVTSSREAARILLESEAETPENLVYAHLGDADAGHPSDPLTTSNTARNRALWLGGIVVVFTFAIVAALALADQAVTDRPVGDPATAVETVQLDAFEKTARDWLALVDAGDWDASFAAAGRSFRDPNTVAMWHEASEQARVPLGRALDRKALTVDLVQSNSGATPKQDSVVVRFATRFENRAEAFETVTLEQEYGEWKVVGYFID